MTNSSIFFFCINQFSYKSGTFGIKVKIIYIETQKIWNNIFEKKKQTKRTCLYCTFHPLKLDHWFPCSKMASTFRIFTRSPFFRTTGTVLEQLSYPCLSSSVLHFARSFLSPFTRISESNIGISATRFVQENTKSPLEGAVKNPVIVL